MNEVRKSTDTTKLNFLEPSGPLQACNGTALPYIQIYIYIRIIALTSDSTLLS